MHQKPLPAGTRIRFVRKLEQGPTEETPAFLFAEKGETGEILHWDGECHYPYTVKTDNFPHSFMADDADFEVIN